MVLLQAHPKMKEELIGHVRSLAPQQVNLFIYIYIYNVVFFAMPSM